MTILKLCGLVLTCLGATAIIKKADGTFAKLICFCTAAMAAAEVVYRTSIATEYVSLLAEKSGMSGYLSSVFKVVALVYISEFTSEICRESEAAILGQCITAFARVEIIVITLPLIRELVDFAVSLC